MDPCRSSRSVPGIESNEIDPLQIKADTTGAGSDEEFCNRLAKQLSKQVKHKIRDDIAQSDNRRVDRLSLRPKSDGRRTPPTSQKEGQEPRKSAPDALGRPSADFPYSEFSERKMGARAREVRGLEATVSLAHRRASEEKAAPVALGNGIDGAEQLGAANIPTVDPADFAHLRISSKVNVPPGTSLGSAYQRIDAIVPNLRDLAISSQLTKMRKGVLYRSARPLSKKQSDIFEAYHSILQIATVIDLRDDDLSAIPPEAESRLLVSSFYQKLHVSAGRLKLSGSLGSRTFTFSETAIRGSPIEGSPNVNSASRSPVPSAQASSEAPGRNVAAESTGSSASTRPRNSVMNTPTPSQSPYATDRGASAPRASGGRRALFENAASSALRAFQKGHVTLKGAIENTKDATRDAVDAAKYATRDMVDQARDFASTSRATERSFVGDRYERKYTEESFVERPRGVSAMPPPATSSANDESGSNTKEPTYSRVNPLAGRNEPVLSRKAARRSRTATPPLLPPAQSPLNDPGVSPTVDSLVESKRQHEESVKRMGSLMKEVPQELLEDIILDSNLYAYRTCLLEGNVSLLHKRKQLLIVNILDAPAIKKRVLEAVTQSPYLPLVVLAKVADKLTGTALAPFYFCKYVIANHTILESYIEMLENCQDNFCLALKLVAISPIPIVFHCSLGKDRTGLLAMMLLHVLGASDAMVVADYTMTEQNRSEFLNYTREFVVDYCGLPLAFCSAQADTMYKTLQYVREVFGGVDSYLDMIGFDKTWRAHLRTRFLQS